MVPEYREEKGRNQVAWVAWREESDEKQQGVEVKEIQLHLVVMTKLKIQITDSVTLIMRLRLKPFKKLPVKMAG